jgi:molybdenum cofactor cytidylyltransferase
LRVAIVLAAGSSRRFGGAKLLARLHGRPLLLHAIDRAREAKAARILVVAGARWARIARLVDHDVILVRARRHDEGLSASIAAGLAAVRPIERELILFLADMPFARMPRMRLGPGIDAMRPEVAGKPGHPMLVHTAVARRLGGKGDRGLAALLDARRIGAVRGAAGNIIDIDTRAALRAGASRPRLR